MNRFRFRFSGVLRYREIIEENKTRTFGVALDHLNHEEERLRFIDNAISGHEKFVEDSSQGKISVRDLQNKYNFARHLDRERDTQAQVISKAHDEMETRRKELIEATKKRKIIERLKERDRESYEIDVRREEQIISDETSTQRFFRRENNR